VPDERRFADVYVFAWHAATDDGADHRDASQWDYFVLPESALPQQKTVSVDRVRRNERAVRATWRTLRSAVDAVAVTIPAKPSSSFFLR
jgi:hypothetical protein